MLKKLLVSFVFVIYIFVNMFITISYGEDITLDQITQKFNNCSTVKKYAEQGYTLSATNTENKINVLYKSEEENIEYNYEYNLEGTVLSAEFSGDDDFEGMMTAIILVDSIGQLHGYEDGELFATLNAEGIRGYTVENEGFEAKEIEEGKYQIKVDISKKIPLIDISKEYFKVSDLEDLKDFISEDGSADARKGNVRFNKSGYDGENTLIIAEKNELTESAYKSVLSIIEVMFGDNKASEYFQTNYPEFGLDKEFTGIKIEVNPTKTEFEEDIVPEDSGYKFARITINKNLVISEINKNEDDPGTQMNEVENNTIIVNETNIAINTANITNTSDNNTKVPSILPNTGDSFKIFILAITFILVGVISYEKYLKYKDIK